MSQRIIVNNDSDIYVWDGANVLEEDIEKRINEDNISLKEVQGVNIYVMTMNTIGKNNVDEMMKDVYSQFGLSEEGRKS